MELLHRRCAGIDISKRDAKVCVRIAGSGKAKTSAEVTTWGSMTNQILALRDHLVAQQVSCVVMEATSDYWKPFFYVLEDMEGVEVMLVNARHVKTVPGRKTDVADAVWLADLAAHGLVRGSLVPPAPIRQLRDLTRARADVTADRTREIQRLEKLLESSGIKLAAVTTTLVGVSGRQMLEALVAGERDPQVLAGMARQRLRAKIPELVEALTGRFDAHHGFMVRMHLDRIDQHTADQAALSARIEELIAPFRAFRDLIDAIPGISTTVAEVIIAETGGDMTRFPSPAHLASWAGICPGHHESAGKKKSSHTRPGDPYLKAALGVAAMAAAKKPASFLGARYARLRKRRGAPKARVAIAHSILNSVWAIGRTGEIYHDLGPDHYRSHHARPGRMKRRALADLEALGYTVTLQQAA